MNSAGRWESSRVDSEDVSRTRLAVVGAEDIKRASTENRDADTPMRVLGKGGRPPMEVAEHPEDSQLRRGTRY